MKPEKTSSITAPANTVNLLDSTALSIILLNAISEQVPLDSPEFDSIKASQGKVTIQLLVNGVSIPDPIKALTNVINQEWKRIDEAAGQRALEMISNAGLNGIHEAMEKTRRTMEQAESELKTALRKVGAEFYDSE